MVKRKEQASCCATDTATKECCRIESLVSIDERGQMVLPKDLRERAGIGPGDKLIVISWQKGEEVCCLTLIKASQLEDRVKEFLGPVMSSMIVVD